MPAALRFSRIRLTRPGGRMLVRNWMSTPVITVDAAQSVFEAAGLLAENNIKRLPVLSSGRLVGIFSEKDLRGAPENARSRPVSDFMTSNPLTIGLEEPVETAALKLHDNRIGALPIVDNAGVLEGIITEDDVFEAMIAMTGARFAGVRISLEIEDQPGTIKQVTDVVRAEGGKIISIITAYQGVRPGYRELILKISLDQAHLIVERLIRVYPGTTVIRT